jgi:hypothetical protein
LLPAGLPFAPAVRAAKLWGGSLKQKLRGKVGTFLDAFVNIPLSSRFLFAFVNAPPQHEHNRDSKKTNYQTGHVHKTAN